MSERKTIKAEASNTAHIHCLAESAKGGQEKGGNATPKRKKRKGNSNQPIGVSKVRDFGG